MTKARELSDYTGLQADLALKSTVASPVFTGNVGVGVTPEAWSTTGVVQVGRVSLTGTPSAIGGSLNWNAYYNSVWKYKDSLQAGSMTLDNGIFTFKVAPSGTADAAISFTTAMTIDNSGNVYVGKTAASTATNGFQLTSSGKQMAMTNANDTLGWFNRTGSDGTVLMWLNDGSNAGTISVSGSSTSYNTSSDYRLKENVTPMSGATAQTKLLKPCNFDWIAGGNVNGFLAHELAEVVPEAVSGTKDAMMDEEYEVTPATDTEAAVMGTRSVPDMQGIDQAKLVPLLTATIQELIARIEVLEGE
jgi:hypothetical protein